METHFLSILEIADQTNMAATSEFQVVRRKKKKSGRKFVPDAVVTRGSSGDETFLDSVSFKSRLLECVQELKLSEFFCHCWDAVLDSLPSSSLPRETTEALALATNTGPPACNDDQIRANESEFAKATTKEENLTSYCQQEVFEAASSPELALLSFGIGHFSQCPIARYQLAFLLALWEKLGKPFCEVYDPMFSLQEQAMLEDLGCSVPSLNEEGKHVCPRPTVVFMPHCGKALYNNLLWANLATLHNLVLLGNSFSAMLERTPLRLLQRTAGYVVKLNPFTEEIPLQTSAFTYSDVFNDLALHRIPRSKLETVPEDFWEGNMEPCYTEEDIEIIQAQSSEKCS